MPISMPSSGPGYRRRVFGCGECSEREQPDAVLTAALPHMRTARRKFPAGGSRRDRTLHGTVTDYFLNTEIDGQNDAHESGDMVPAESLGTENQNGENRKLTSKEMTSCMILSWMSEKGPPFSTNPNRLAGT